MWNSGMTPTFSRSVALGCVLELDMHEWRPVKVVFGWVECQLDVEHCSPLTHAATHGGIDLSYNMGVGVSQVEPSNCFRHLEKSVLPSISDKSLSSLIMWNVQSYPTTVLNVRMWQLWGSKHWPLLHIFRAVRTLPLWSDLNLHPLRMLLPT